MTNIKRPVAEPEDAPEGLGEALREYRAQRPSDEDVQRLRARVRAAIRNQQDAPSGAKDGGGRKAAWSSSPQFAWGTSIASALGGALATVACFVLAGSGAFASPESKLNDGRAGPPPIHREVITKCQPVDRAACSTECQAGNLTACWIDGRERSRDGSGDLAAAADSLRKACNPSGPGAIPEACATLGSISLRLSHGENKAQAAALYEKGCTLGSPAACGGLAWMISSKGGGYQTNDARSVELLTNACVRGHHNGSCAVLASLLFEGDDELPADPELALTLARRACDEHILFGCATLGQIWLHEGKNKRAIDLLSKTCSSGDVRACMELATYLEGEGAQQDLAEAAALYERVLKSPDYDVGERRGVAAYRLGVMYLTGGVGLPQDLTRSLSGFARACDEGIAVGCDEVVRFHVTR